jgi:DNA-directed RNA polymerase specialized sigma subunit
MLVIDKVRQDPGDKEKKRRGILATPLTKRESWMIGALYQQNIKLIKYFGAKVCKTYPDIPPVEVFSCIDIAFVKAARTWKPDKGTLSTHLGNAIRGEISHYVRSNNHWGYSAPRKLREMGMEARRLMTHRRVPLSVLPTILGCTQEELREALAATLKMNMFRDIGDTVADYHEDEEDENFDQ